MLGIATLDGGVDAVTNVIGGRDDGRIQALQGRVSARFHADHDEQQRHDTQKRGDEQRHRLVAHRGARSDVADESVQPGTHRTGARDEPIEHGRTLLTGA